MVVMSDSPSSFVSVRPDRFCRSSLSHTKLLQPETSRKQSHHRILAIINSYCRSIFPTWCGGSYCRQAMHWSSWSRATCKYTIILTGLGHPKRLSANLEHCQCVYIVLVRRVHRLDASLLGGKEQLVQRGPLQAGNSCFIKL